jgi:hypothetical protein
MHSNSSQVPDLGLSDVRGIADDLHLVLNCQLQGLMRFYDAMSTQVWVTETNLRESP